MHDANFVPYAYTTHVFAMIIFNTEQYYVNLFTYLFVVLQVLAKVLGK